MKLIVVLLLVIGVHSYGYGQASKTNDSTLTKALISASDISCKCVDSINIYNKTREEVAAEVHDCIKINAVVYQTMAKFFGMSSAMFEKSEIVDGKQTINLDVNANENSDEFKKYYYEIERDMMNHCEALKSKIKSDENTSRFSVSYHPEALDFYNKGQAEMRKENFADAVVLYESAVKIDPNFAFAWDNIGICYRKLGDYDKAIVAYKQSLEIDPLGMTPLQNIAIAYEYKNEFEKAIDAYQQIAAIDKSNPEVYYGIGRIYAGGLQDFEKGLDNMCKAYNLYVEQKSPYRTDAETLINAIYGEMKKAGKEETFNKILKNNHISPSDK